MKDFELKKLFGEKIECTTEELKKIAEHRINSTVIHTEENKPIDEAKDFLKDYKKMLESRKIDCDFLECRLINLLSLGMSMYKSENVKEILLNTLLKKNADYGNSAIKSGGLVGNYVRLSDKVSRLESLKVKKENFESVQDTWLDIAGYAVLGLIILELTEKKISGTL